MRKEDIKTGQRIILTKEAETLRYVDKNHSFKAGMRGKIINTRNTLASRVLVEFDDCIFLGHNGASVDPNTATGKDGHCWWFYKEDLIKIAKIYKRKNNY